MTALMLNADTDLRQVGWLTPGGFFVSMEVHPPRWQTWTPVYVIDYATRSGESR